ncbi:MAG: class I SAM-dependent methyltransferase [Nitrospiraceae bacterium]
MRKHSTQNGRSELQRFQRLQVEHFAKADEAKFLWQTTDPYLARTERELLKQVPFTATDRLLEVGCGEGGNLELLQTIPAHTVGVDFSRAKVGWALGRVRRARFVCSDAGRLPFRGACFDVILCRDVLHHVADKSRVVEEMVRVCRPEGRIVIIEPNGSSPIMRLLGILVPAERDLVRNSLQRIARLLDRRQVDAPNVAWAQPFPFGRVLFHYRWGLPWLSGWLASFVLHAERLLGALIPSGWWSYMILSVIKQGPQATKPLQTVEGS